MLDAVVSLSLIVTIRRNRSSQFVNQHSTVTHFPRPTVTHLQEGGQAGRHRRWASPQDDPFLSFLCRSSLLAFPSLPDEKELL